MEERLKMIMMQLKACIKTVEDIQLELDQLRRQQFLAKLKDRQEQKKMINIKVDGSVNRQAMAAIEGHADPERIGE